MKKIKKNVAQIIFFLFSLEHINVYDKNNI